MMNELSVKLCRLHPDAVIPTYGSQNAAGADLYTVDDEVTIAPGETRLMHTGISMEIPDSWCGLIYARSGLATKQGLAPANKVGGIDSDYRGELMVSLYNQSSAPRTVQKGERIAQLVFAPAPQAVFTVSDTLSQTERADGGFGSTGRK